VPCLIFLFSEKFHFCFDIQNGLLFNDFVRVRSFIVPVFVT